MLINALLLDMIFNEDAILMQFFEIYEDEEELKEAVLKYGQGSSLEKNRPEAIEVVKGDMSELDMVNNK